MKWFYGIIIAIAAITLVIHFDAVVVFMLSGFIPALDLTLPPSTMLAVFVASAILLFALSKRQAVYHYCLALYDYNVDALFGFGKKNDTPVSDNKPKLPRRRYQEL